MTELSREREVTIEEIKKRVREIEKRKDVKMLESFFDLT